MAAHPRSLHAVILLLAAACTGNIADPRGSGSGRGDPVRDRPTGSRDVCADDGSLSPTSRLSRLSHTQLANTLRDLLHLEAAPSEPSGFIPDPQQTGFDNDATRLSVSPDLGRAYQRLAEQLAADVAASPDAVFPRCDATDDACVVEGIGELGRRAYRRPLTEEEVADLHALFVRGPELVAGGDPFEDGVELVLTAMLQSPNFLYRVERSEAPDGGEVALGPWEIASRLSYALWGSMPDDELFAAAGSGALSDPEEVAAQAERMLDDPKAARMVEDFYGQLLSLESYVEIDRDPALNPAWSNDLVPDLQRETELFVRDVVLTQRGGLEDLLAASYTFANDRTVAIYGGDVVDDPGGSGFRRVELDPARRAGLLTQLGFLASNAYRSETDPIHRGVFLHRRILCSTLPDPPDDIDTTLPPPSGELRTTRQRVEHATSGPDCQRCHLLINEPGFAFESFDAIGQYRAEDNGVPVHTAGRLPVDGEMLPFDDAVGLARSVAGSEAASKCYTKQYFRYAHGRTDRAGDCDALAELSRRLRDGDLDLRSLMVEVVTHQTFLHRTDEVSE